MSNSLVFLSDDNNHDYHAVDYFFKKSVEYLEGEGIAFSKLVVFSDGCASQYKRKGSFADLSLKTIAIERNFFGSDHGKSECDGEVGCVNRALDMAVLGRKVVVSDADDIFTWCSTNLCLDEVCSKRRFFLVKPDDINRDIDVTNVKTLQGCRKLHQVVNVPNSPYKLLVKKLSCYCILCINDQTDDCPNKPYTGAFETRMLEKLSSCQIYDDLQQTIAQAELEALPQLPEVTFLTHKRTIDESAIGLIPEDQTASGLYPCNVYGDGNCLPRCASLLVYGHENNHLEMRARIIDEFVRNEDNYLNNNFLSNGCNSSAHGDVAIQFAMFSEKYYAQKLSGVAVQRIFRAEVLDLCRSGQYMGAWQMAALANVLKTEVVSVYPMYGGKTMRNNLHRRFPPFRASELDKAKKVYYYVEQR